MSGLLLFSMNPRATLTGYAAQILLCAYLTFPGFLAGQPTLMSFVGGVFLVASIVSVVRMLRSWQKLNAAAELTRRFVKAVRGTVAGKPYVHQESHTGFIVSHDRQSLLPRWTLTVLDSESLDVLADAIADENTCSDRPALTWQSYWAMPSLFGVVFTAADGDLLTLTSGGEIDFVNGTRTSRPTLRAIRNRLAHAGHTVATRDDVAEMVSRLEQAQPLPNVG